MGTHLLARLRYAKQITVCDPMKPPIFSPLQSPTPALDWHARARMYRQQAMELVDIVNGQPN